MKKVFTIILIAVLIGVIALFLTGGPPLNTMTFTTTKISSYTINKSLMYDKTKQQKYKEAMITII